MRMLGGLLTDGRPAARTDTKEWPAIQWSEPERQTFDFLRSQSDETSTLAAAIESSVHASPVGDPARASAVDFGGNDNDLGRRLRDIFKTYLPLAIEDSAAGERCIERLENRPVDADDGFDVCIFSHVLPYLADVARALHALARSTRREAVGIAVLCDTTGDQYQVGQLAARYDRSYDRTHGHIERFEKLLSRAGVDHASFRAVSTAKVTNQLDVYRLLSFYTGSSDLQLLERIAQHFPPAEDGSYRLTSAHRIVRWSMHAFRY